MPKYFGKIGFMVTKETKPDIWEEDIEEREYSGELLRVQKRWQGSDHLNDNLSISNRLSILSDPFAYNNFQSIRYATWMGAKWKVTSVEVAYPRLLLDLGGVYNEQKQNEGQ